MRGVIDELPPTINTAGMKQVTAIVKPYLVSRFDAIKRMRSKQSRSSKSKATAAKKLPRQYSESAFSMAFLPRSRSMFGSPLSTSRGHAAKVDVARTGRMGAGQDLCAKQRAGCARDRVLEANRCDYFIAGAQA